MKLLHFIPLINEKGEQEPFPLLPTELCPGVKPQADFLELLYMVQGSILSLACAWGCANAFP